MMTIGLTVTTGAGLSLTHLHQEGPFVIEADQDLHAQDTTKPKTLCCLLRIELTSRYIHVCHTC